MNLNNKKQPNFTDYFDELYEDLDLNTLFEVKHNIENVNPDYNDFEENLNDYYDDFQLSLEKDLTEILK
jgi:hypothetical protein